MTTSDHVTPDRDRLADFTHHREFVATRDYVHYVGKELDLDAETAEKVADFFVSEAERTGGADARLVFIADGEDAGTGPLCSWCWALGGLCSHIAGGASEHV